MERKIKKSHQAKINEDERCFDIFKLSLAVIIISLGLWYWSSHNYGSIEDLVKLG